MNFPIEVYTIIIECLLIFYFFHKEVRPVYPSRRYIILFCISLFAVIMLSTLYTPMFIRLVIISLFLFLCYTFFNFKNEWRVTMDYGLIGEKLGHSYSKIIHEKLADYTYDLCPLSKEEFKDFMEKREFKAINVTIPYKKDVIPYLKEMDESAVNTIVNKEGNLYGYNTDMPGFIYMVNQNKIQMKDKKVVVLGNGGAAQAIKAAVQKLGAREMIVVDIVPAEGVISYDECFAHHTDADILVNTSPVGMYPKVDASPVDLTAFPHCQAVLDVIYNPITTKLVAQARELGMIGVTGLEMLVAQALYAVEIFLQNDIPEEKIQEIYKGILETL